jgi:hypothetical protein
MAYKLINRRMGHELRFPTPRSARRYADQFGGAPEQWDIVPAGDGNLQSALASVPVSLGSS